jgi:hypothetical protein
MTVENLRLRFAHVFSRDKHFKMSFGKADGGAESSQFALDLRRLQIDAVKLSLVSVQTNNLTDCHTARDSSRPDFLFGKPV